MLTMYGIKNCDTIKKPAAGWKRIRLSIASMITAPMALSAQLDTFIAELGWQALLNTRGTTAQTRRVAAQ